MRQWDYLHCPARDPPHHGRRRRRSVRDPHGRHPRAGRRARPSTRSTSSPPRYGALGRAATRARPRRPTPISRATYTAVPAPVAAARADVAGAGTLRRPMAATKRFHVTTFGCQMNEHDSERMKGMLESLGYAEAPQRDEADLILFNTCSIREAADSRFVAHLHQAKGVKRARPDVVIGVGGCWAQSVKDDVFRQFPFVDVAFGPGQVHKLAEFLTSDSLTAQGYFEFEGFTGPPAGQARARVPGLGADLGRLQLPLLVLHRALARAGARSRGRSTSSSTRSARQVADGAREVTLLGPERQLLRPRPASGGRPLVRRAAARPGRHRRARPPALHEPAPQGHARGRHPRPRRAGLGLRAHPPAAAVGLQRDPQGDAPHLRPRPLPGPRRADPRARARLRDHDRHHRRLPGRDRGGLRPDARGLRGGRLRRRLHVRLLAAPRDRGGDDHRGPRARTRSRSSAWSGSSRSSSAAPTSARSASSAARSTCWSKGRRAPTPSRIRGRSRHGKTVNFTGLARARRDRAGRDPLGHEHDAGRRGIAALARGGLAARWRAWRSSASARSALRWPPPCSPPAATSCCCAGAGALEQVVVELPDGSAVVGARTAAHGSRARRRGGRMGAAGREGATRRRARRAGCRRCAGRRARVAVLQNGIDHVERVGAAGRRRRGPAGGQLVPGRAGGARPRAPARRPAPRGAGRRGGGGAGGAARRATPTSRSAVPSSSRRGASCAPTRSPA